MWGWNQLSPFLSTGFICIQTVPGQCLLLQAALFLSGSSLLEHERDLHRETGQETEFADVFPSKPSEVGGKYPASG